MRENQVVDEVLSRRALNRATLARQLLLRRDARTPLAAVQHLVGMQAQVPHDPYPALWSRLEGFRPESVSELLERREVVRVGVMRGTIHLVTADDCLLLRPLMQPVFEAQLRRHGEHAPALRGVDLKPVVEFARALLAESRGAGPSCVRCSRVRQRGALARRPQPVRHRSPSRSRVAGERVDHRLGIGATRRRHPRVSRREEDGLIVRHVDSLSKKPLATIATESRRLARFLETDTRDVRLVELS